MAKAINKTSDAEKYQKLFQDISNAFIKTYVK